jgi:hypothetical protein
MSRWLLSAAAMFLLSAAAAAAPVVRMIDDFEGPSPRLTDDAQIIEIEGNHVLRWQPTGNEPLFLNYDYRGRGVEMAEWDRLAFRYRIEADAVD